LVALWVLAGPPSLAVAGTLVWPVSNPNPMTNPYAALNVIGNNEYHTGFDLTSSTGNTDVYAAGAGFLRSIPRTTYANDNHGMGNVIVIDHNQGKGPFTLYAHLASFVVFSGSVVAGQKIAVMGNTGCTPCNVHLHFEVKLRNALGNLHDDLGPEWGYTPQHPNLYGYLNPWPYLDYNLAFAVPTGVRSSSNQIVRTGPDAALYTTTVTTVATNQEFAAFSQWGGWYQVFLPSSQGPATGWIQAAAPASGVLREVNDPSGSSAGTGVRVRSIPSTSGSTILSYVWDKQAIVSAGQAPSGNGCALPWQQTHLATNASASLGWVCGDYLTGGGTAVPSVTTGSASNIGPTTATVAAMVNANGASTEAWFDYGTTLGYGSSTAHQNLGSGTSAVPVSFNLAGLTCNTLYHFRGVASNAAGPNWGTDAVFTTAPCPALPPTVTTGSATSVGATTATVSGTVNPNGVSTEAWFEYGTTMSYGLSTPHQSIGMGTAGVPVAAVLAGLTCNTLYHFHLVASSSAGTSPGTDSSFTTASCGSVPKPIRDHNGDGRADLLWRNTSGQLVAWYMNGAALVGWLDFGVVSTAWRIDAVADFDGDTRADILWRYQSTGAAYMWFMNGGTILSHGSPTTYRDSSWSVAGLGDLDGNGTRDIAWRTSGGQLATWLMQGTTVAAVGEFGQVSTAWQLAALADLNGDGRADMLWRAPGTGATYAWFMQGNTIVGYGPLSAAYDASWQLAGRGDLNGDGRADLIWRRTDGRLAVWLMDGLTAVQQADFGLMATAWQLQEVDDFDGDGNADMLWRYTPTGGTALWFMSGTTIVSAASTGAYTDMSWTLQSALR
jgi:hypothetical protein